jgi:hypothetical protein
VRVGGGQQGEGGRILALDACFKGTIVEFPEFQRQPSTLSCQQHPLPSPLNFPHTPVHGPYVISHALPQACLPLAPLLLEPPAFVLCMYTCSLTQATHQVTVSMVHNWIAHSPKNTMGLLGFCGRMCHCSSAPDMTGVFGCCCCCS